MVNQVTLNEKNSKKVNLLFIGSINGYNIKDVW